ncbi:MAG: glutathione S-transferase N-terminal domain-containing protein [Robiginitomaculum sp.]|nr:glutathione S-transferase N-terminal domain-containing protein [Robiginitomaculum sp.]
MRILYHWPLDPFSRMARLALAEKRLTFKLSRVEFTDDPAALLALNPAGSTPVLRDESGATTVIVAEARPILEYLDEAREAAPPYCRQTCPDAPKCAGWWNGFA